jgi:hypothetical protein
MATLYLDFENGNDNYAGSSFALKASGTDGTIVGSTFTSATASFPNDGSLIGQYLSIFNGTIYAIYNITAWVSATSLTIAAISGGTALANQAARQYYIGGRWKTCDTGATAVRTIPGDTIRVMGSPAPTSLGQTAVWTSQALQATKTITSSTNATPIAITSTAHGYSTGDTVVITGHTTNTNANGTWEVTNTGANTFTLDGSVGNGVGGATGTVRLRNNTRVKLTTAVTQNIASTGPGRAAWTASANVTTSTTTTSQKEGATAEVITISAAFTTGKAAYWALPTATNLSGYQQVSFWIRSDLIGGIAAGVHELRLCSDTTGDVTVNTISIPAMSGTSRWMPFTVDLGTNLGSSIQSIALYVVTDTGAQTLLLNNIIACKASSAADSLTLTSLIGKNITGETFWGIQSINGTRVMLDADTSAIPTSTTVRGYYGTSATVTTWKRETIKLGPAAAASTALQTFAEDGDTTVGNTTYSGGWDRTAMTTQNLETWLDGVNGNGIVFAFTSRRYITAEKFAMTRCFQAADLGSGIFHLLDLVAVNNTTSGLFNGAIFTNGAGSCIIKVDHVVASASVGVYLSSVFDTLFVGWHISSNGNSSIRTVNGKTYVYPKSSGWIGANNGGQGIVSSDQCFIYDCTLENNTSVGVALAGYDTYLDNCLINDATEVSNAFGSNSYLFSHNHDQIIGNHKIFVENGLISSATDQRKTASGISWKLQPLSAAREPRKPLTLSLAKVACAANSLVTIKAWMRRDNTGLTMRLVCKGSQIAGVTSDVVSAMTAAANTWEELTITFTPTEVGVVEITAESWGGTTYSGWVDDMTISQA